MTARMYNVLYYLKAYVRDSVLSTIKITEAFDDGTEFPGTLHTEGRAIKVTYPTANTPANLKTISQFALCAQADYVGHRGEWSYLLNNR